MLLANQVPQNLETVLPTNGYGPSYQYTMPRQQKHVPFVPNSKGHSDLSGEEWDLDQHSSQTKGNSHMA